MQYHRRVGNDHLDAQTSARLLKRALAIKGSREKLAEALAVRPEDLALWLAGKTFPPQAIFESVLEIILDENQQPAPASAEASQPARHRVLIAENAEGYAVLARILGGQFTLVPARTLTEGLDLLQNSAVARHHAIDAIVCGQHFEGSQMLRFLECVKAYRQTSAIPFLCCRATSTQLRDTALSAMREACEALGAVAYIDLPERESRAGAEKAAVEFRDAERAPADGGPRSAKGGERGGGAARRRPAQARRGGARYRHARDVGLRPRGEDQARALGQGRDLDRRHRPWHARGRRARPGRRLHAPPRQAGHARAAARSAGKRAELTTRERAYRRLEARREPLDHGLSRARHRL